MTPVRGTLLTISDTALTGTATVTVTVNADPAQKALQFAGTNAFVTFGRALNLGASTFTIETWFRRDGAGVATLTGSDGVTAVVGAERAEKIATLVEQVHRMTPEQREQLRRKQSETAHSMGTS